MAKELLPDALWARIAPLLPSEPQKPKGGRPRVSDRAALPPGGRTDALLAQPLPAPEDPLRAPG